MQVIGFFKGLLDNFGGIINFVNTPLGKLNNTLSATPLGDLSIFNMLSIGLGATLLTLLVIHVVRLFVGG